MIEQSIRAGREVSTLESGYRWSCGMCGGLGLVEEEGKFANCPKCETAHRFGIAFELIRRNVTPTISTSERLASPAVGAPSFVYEVWEFFLKEGTARRVVVEDDVGVAYGQVGFRRGGFRADRGKDGAVNTALSPEPREWIERDWGQG